MATTYSQGSTRMGPEWPALWLTAFGFGVFALVFRLGQLHSTASFDEYYHLLGARGWLETGRPTILDGEYSRTSLFTGAVAELFRLTGNDTFTTGRLISVVAGMLLPPLVFLWVRAWAGWGAALIAAALTVLWPQGIDEAQRLRFYTWHTLFTFIGTVAVFQAFESRAGGGRGCAGWGGAAVFAFVAAFYLQITTAFAIGAILVWVGFVHLLPRIMALDRSWLLLGLIAVAFFLMLAAAWSIGVLEGLWQQYRWVPGWSEHRSNNSGYYHGLLRADYPVFWPLLPFAVLLGLRVAPRLAIYNSLIFGLGFVVLSFGGMKGYRYLSYAMPFFFIIVALGTTEFILLMRGSIASGHRRLDPTRGGWFRKAAVTAAVLFFIAANPFFDRSVDALRGKSSQYFSQREWNRLPELVGDWAGLPYLITTRELQTIAYLGNYDVLFEHSRMTEMKPPVEFAVDPRTGRPVIDNPKTVATLLACHPEGLFLTDTGQWENQGQRDELMPVFEASRRKIESRKKYGLLALHWSGGVSDSAACIRLLKNRRLGF